MPLIGTTRFNNNTWKQNCDWRQHSHPSGCAYGLMKPIGLSIPLNSLVFVLEMNNSNNEILGIGLINNCPDPMENVRIYKDYNYCCYLYKGKLRIDRSEFNEIEKKIIQILEHLVFKGSSHLKRGQGITKMPDKMIHYVMTKGMNIIKELQTMFISRN